MIVTELLRRADGGLKLEVSVGPDEIGFIGSLINGIGQSAGISMDLARQWARLYRGCHGHRFIAGNIRFEWVDDLIEEGLVLEAGSEEEYELLRLKDMVGDGVASGK